MEFAEQLARFKQRTHGHHYKALIVLGTKQEETAALLIGALQPERVAFLLTDATRDMPAKIAALLDMSEDGWFKPQGNFETQSAVYTGLKTILQEWRDLDLSQIIADVTGGMKPMSLGLEKAAYVLGIQTVYVQSDYDGRNLVPGTQHLDFPPDPYKEFGDLKANEAYRLYAKHDYAGAQRMFAELAEHTIDTQRAEYAALADLAAAYSAWDALDLKLAARLLVALLAKPLPDSLADRHAILTKQAAIVSYFGDGAMNLADTEQVSLDVYRPVATTLDLLGIILSNAERRYDQGRYDIAALLYYRAVELISQHRLANYGITPEKPTYDEAKQKVPGLLERHEDAWVALKHDREKKPKLPTKALSLFESYVLLQALDDPIVRNYDVTLVGTRNTVRNRSILAHGYRPIELSEYRQFVEVVEHFLDRLFALQQVDRASWKRDHWFIDLPART